MNPPFGSDQPCFVIAEAGVNHNGDPDLARKLIDVAAEAGADAVKFQTFRAEALAGADAPLADYMVKESEQAQDQVALLKRLELPMPVFEELSRYCDEKGVRFMSTAFDEESADALDAMGMDVIKVPSGELTNLPFLQHLAGLGQATILSTGMGTLGEVEAAVTTLEESGAGPIAILHCVSQYPAPPEAMNLCAMDTLRAAFNHPVGLSDHTLGMAITWAAVARGANIIEKHFTLDRKMEGPDHAASLEPDELKAMVQGIRDIESALGDGRKRPRPEEMNTRVVARRSVVLARDLSTGHVIQSRDLELRRPGDGMPPEDIHRLVGMTIERSLPKGHKLSWSDVGSNVQ